MGILTKILLRPGAVKALRAADEILKDVTPMNFDCGRLCGKGCCRTDDTDNAGDTDENGMMLFPYEEEIMPPPSEAFPYRVIPSEAVRRDGRLLVCEGRCEREHRPLACRIFPLRIAVMTDPDTDEPYAAARIDPRAKRVCPLAGDGIDGMAPEFVKAVEAAGEALLKNTVQMQALYEEQDALKNAEFLDGRDAPDK